MPLARGHARGGVQGWALEGRDTWIGATDGAALLRFLGFEAVLLDFTSPSAVAAQAAARKALLDAQRGGRDGGGGGASGAARTDTLHGLWAAAGSARPLVMRVTVPLGARLCH